jgi:hypothetical protein
MAAAAAGFAQSELTAVGVPTAYYTSYNTLARALSSGTVESCAVRSAWRAHGNLSQVRVRLADFFIYGPQIVNPLPNEVRVRVSLEYPAGVLTPLTFRGQPETTLSAAAQASLRDVSATDSDLAPVQIPHGARFWIRSEWTVPPGGQWWNFRRSSVHQNQEAVGMPAGSTHDSPTVSPTAGDMPDVLAVEGVSDRPTPSFLIMGDSIARHEGDGIFGHSGMYNRTFSAMGPVLNIALTGSKLSQWIGRPDIIEMFGKLGPRFKYTICGIGRNDVTSGATLDELKANMADLWRMIAQEGSIPVACTITPRSTSVDLFRTLTGQSSTSHNAAREAYNAWVRDRGPAGARAQHPYLHTAVVDFAHGLEQNDGTGRWRAFGQNAVATVVSYDPQRRRLVSQGMNYLDTNVFRRGAVGYRIRWRSNDENFDSTSEIQTVLDANTVELTAKPRVNPPVGASFDVRLMLTTDGTHPTSGATIYAIPSVDPLRFP